MMELNFELIAGALCLDFANTVHCYGATDPRDDLREYDDLVAWGIQAGLLETRTRRINPSPSSGARQLQMARETRGLIYRMFSRLDSGHTPHSADLRLFSDKLAEAMRHRRVATTGPVITWTWDPEGTPTDHILWRVFDSTATLLTSGEGAHVRECSSPTCTWLFLDHSKNKTRKWCDMKLCGNREKSRRHYARVRRHQAR